MGRNRIAAMRGALGASRIRNGPRNAISGILQRIEKQFSGKVFANWRQNRTSASARSGLIVSYVLKGAAEQTLRAGQSATGSSAQLQGWASFNQFRCHSGRNIF